MAAQQFNVAGTMAHDANWKLVPRYLLRAYTGAGTASVIESKQQWATREDAQAACDRANDGDESGLSFGLYSDD